jgi:hypothetical protein
MKKILEYHDYQKNIKLYTTISDEELMEMANISPKKTGIDNVFLWVGPNPVTHGKRIKVSNIPNKFSKDDCFTITIPEYKVVGNVNTKLISNKVLEDIILFIEINKNIIIDFSDEKISTDELIDNLISIKN